MLPPLTIFFLSSLLLFRPVFLVSPLIPPYSLPFICFRSHPFLRLANSYTFSPPSHTFPFVSSPAIPVPPLLVPTSPHHSFCHHHHFSIPTPPRPYTNHSSSSSLSPPPLSLPPNFSHFTPSPLVLFPAMPLYSPYFPSPTFFSFYCPLVRLPTFCDHFPPSLPLPAPPLIPYDPPIPCTLALFFLISPPLIRCRLTHSMVLPFLPYPLPCSIISLQSPPSYRTSSFTQLILPLPFTLSPYPPLFSLFFLPKNILGFSTPPSYLCRPQPCALLSFLYLFFLLPLIHTPSPPRRMLNLLTCRFSRPPTSPQSIAATAPFSHLRTSPFDPPHPVPYSIFSPSTSPSPPFLCRLSHPSPALPSHSSFCLSFPLISRSPPDLPL